MDLMLKMRNATMRPAMMIEVIDLCNPTCGGFVKI